MGMMLPTRLPSGSKAWLSGEAQDFIDRLTQLDDRLALVLNPNESWSIWRVAEDGSEHLIAKSKPYAKLDESVILKLQEGDLRRRGLKVVEDMIEANDRLQKERDEKTEDVLNEAMEKVYSVAWRGPWRGEVV